MSTSPNTSNNRILVIDDNPSIHEDFRKILLPAGTSAPQMLEAEAALFGEASGAEEGTRFEIDSAFQGQEGLDRVQQSLKDGVPYAMAFVDVRMPPGWDGVETIARIWKVCPELQVVICTAYSDFSWEEIINRVGATDSLVILKKPFDNVEVLQLAHALTKKWLLMQQAKDRLVELDKMVHQRTRQLQEANVRLQKEMAEREKIDEELRVSQERFAKAFRATPIPMAIQTLQEERYVHVNDAFLKTLEYRPDEVIGQTAAAVGIWAQTETREQILAQLRQRGSIRNESCQFRTKSGQVREICLSAELLSLWGESNMLVIAEDVSERLHLEKRLRESQKMEAIGQLAAGVAHDFNNILTIIQGHVSLRLAEATLDRKLSDSLQQVADASTRAANLTRQLLAFSARQMVQPKVLNLNQTVRQLQNLLLRLIGEHITLHCTCAEALPPVEADEGSIEQVIMNLVVNARDAMPKGGRLCLRTEAVEIDEASAARNPQARPGRFVCLRVVDAGCGIDPAILDRIFEPFFTTKGFGKGTGLGLATAFGIAKQHHGWIEVASEVGHGSTFSVYLPTSDKRMPQPAPQSASAKMAQGREKILLVEDEDLLRELLREALQYHGYRVAEAPDGVQALKIWKEKSGDFDVLVTDIVMPNGVTGLELGAKLRQAKPHLKLIYTSGYNSEMAGKDFAPDEGMAFLQKPYKPGVLLQTIRDTLDQPASDQKSSPDAGAARILATAH